MEFEITFQEPFDLPAGHYFFVPQVGLADNAPAGADFLWLSAPKPIVPPGTPFPAGATDLQSWMRDDPALAPDWLRIGTDIIGGTTFNATFSLSGQTVVPHIAQLSRSSAPERSPDLTITITGSNFTSNSSVVIDRTQPVLTTFIDANHLQATIPADFLAEEGKFQLAVFDGVNDFSNARTFKVTESVPAIDATAVNGLIFRQITLSGQVLDTAPEAHKVQIKWGDGQVQVLDLPANSDGHFSVTHTFAQPGHLRHDTIVVTPLDDEGVAGHPLKIDVLV